MFFYDCMHTFGIEGLTWYIPIHTGNTFYYIGKAKPEFEAICIFFRLQNTISQSNFVDRLPEPVSSPSIIVADSGRPSASRCTTK